MHGIIGVGFVLIAVVLYGVAAIGCAWLFGGAARLGGPDDPRR